MSDAGLVNPRVFIESVAFTAVLFTIIGGSVVVYRMRLLEPKS